MASSLLIPYLWSDDDVMRVRRLLEWQVEEYDGRIRRGTVLFTGLLLGEIVLFTSYALVGFVLPASSFFLTLLENYGFQLCHLTSHAIALVAIYVHLSEMYVGM
jgi:hypothetical protein